MKHWTVAAVILALGVNLAANVRLTARARASGRISQPAADRNALAPHSAPDPEVEKGLQAYGAGRYNEARARAENLLRDRNRKATYAEALDLLVESWLAQGDFTQARLAAKRYKSKAPKGCEEALAHIDARERTYRTALAQCAAQKARARKPEEAAHAQLVTGHLHREFGRLDLAEQAYRNVIATYPKTESAKRAKRHLDSLRGKPSFPNAAAKRRS